MIPVNVVTGFLGSGKTTLLREVLSREAFADSAVIVNEFGEVGLDHVLLEQVDEGVLLLESGCICCTIRSDLQETIRDLQARATRGEIPPFRRVIVETTGLADPSPIVSTIAAEPVIRNHFEIGNIVCTLDAVLGARTLATHEEARKQVSIADRILITKTDLVGDDAVGALQDHAGRLNPMAQVSCSTGAEVDAASLFARDLRNPSARAEELLRALNAAERLAAPAPHHHHAGRGGHAADASSFVLRFEAPMDWVAFGVWLTALLHTHGERILRVKGVLHVAESDTPVAIHGVQHVVHPPMHLGAWPSDERTSRIVFITRGLDAAPIRASLQTFLGLAAP